MYTKNNPVTAVGFGCTGFAPTPTFSPNEMDFFWKGCAQFDNDQDCVANDYENNLECGFYNQCNICIPGNMFYPGNIVSRGPPKIKNCAILQYYIDKAKQNNSSRPLPTEKLNQYWPYNRIFGGNLQKITLPITANVLLSDGTLENYFDMGNSFYNPSQICNGDSGGPVFFNLNKKLFILGVMVRGGAYSGTETNVFAFTDWIDDIILRNTPEK